MIRLEKERVLWADNDVYLGDILKKEDGFYDFWPLKRPGCYWPAHLLRAIADKLDEMNAPWQKEIDDYFSK